VVRIDLVDTKTDFTRSWVLDNESFPGVLVIDVRDCQWDGDTVKILSDWISFVETSEKDLSSSRLLYVLPTGANFDPDSLVVPSAVKELLATECPVLLSLRERIPDTAVYIQRLLSVDARSRLGAENLRRLAHYSWPGGYKELQTRLEQVQKHVEDNGSLSLEDFKALFGEGVEDLLLFKGSLDLEGYLKRRQREYLTLHREPGEDLKDTLLRLGIKGDTIDPEEILKDEVMIYPEILSEPVQ
jgi:hypothetical protein